jgi:hypothetical protein
MGVARRDSRVAAGLLGVGASAYGGFGSDAREGIRACAKALLAEATKTVGYQITDNVHGRL